LGGFTVLGTVSRNRREHRGEEWFDPDRPTAMEESSGRKRSSGTTVKYAPTEFTDDPT